MAASLGGCNCNPPADVKKVAITSPKNGATVTMREDVDNTKSGLQLAVKVGTEKIATDGTGFVKILVDGTASNQAIVGADGTATVVIDTTLLTLPDSAHILTAVGGDETGTAESAKVSVTFDSSELDGCEVLVSVPKGGDKLNSKSDIDSGKAGIQTEVSIHTAGCGALGKIRVCLQGDGLTGTACKGNAGIAVAEANISPDNTTRLTVDWVEGAVVVIGEHEVGAKVTDSAAVLVSVDSSAPTCTFVSPLDGAVLTASNVDVQLKVTGSEAGQAVTLTSNLKPEAQTGTVTDTGEAAIAAILPLGEQTLTAKVVDPAGNEGTCAVTVTVNIEGCDVLLTDPPGGEYLFNIANASPGGTPVMGKYTIRGKSTQCPGGLAKFTKTVGGVDADLGTADVDGNGYFSRPLLFPDAEKDAVVTVKIEKTGFAANGGAYFTYSTDFVAPTCTFESPKDGDTVTTQSPSVRLTVTDAEVDQDVVLSTSGKPETMTGKVSVVGGEVTIPASLPLGEQTLTVAVSDKAKNEGTCAIAVTVNVEGCDIVLSDPATPELIVNIANGNPSGTPLAGKYTVKGTTTRCAGGTLTVTKVIGGTAGTPGTATVASDGTFSYDVTFADGEFNSSIQLKIDQAGMAAGTPTEIAYFSDFTPPTLDLAVPALGNLFVVNASNPHLIAGEAGYVLDEDSANAGGTVTANLNVTGIGTVATTGYGSALPGSATVKVGATTPISATTVSNAQQSVSGKLELAEGFNGAVLITLTDSAGNATTGQWDAKVATAALPAALTISNPQAGTINVFRDLGGDRSSYAQVQSVVTFGVTAPAGAQLMMCSTIQYQGAAAGCQAGYYVLPGTVVTASGTSQFYGGLKLPQGEQDIIAQMSDAVGGVATSAPIHLIVDTVPPVVTSVVATNDADANGTIAGSELAANQDATFTANITGADGQQASFTTTDSTGKVATVFATVTSGVATFVVKGIPDGAFTGKVSVTSAHGNPNASTAVSPAIANAAASMTVAFQRVAPSISVVAPNFTVCNQAKQKQPPSGPNVCDIDFTVSVGTSTTRVDFSLNPTSAGTFPGGSVTTFTNGRATKTFALNQSTSAVTLNARAYDAAGNYRDASWTFTLIDTIAPDLTIVAPANNSIQFAQRFPFSVTTDAEAGQAVIVKSSSNGQVVGSGLVAAGTPNGATFDVSVPGTNQTLTATVTDLAGNTSPARSIDIQMQLNGCDVNFINPATADPIFNASVTTDGWVHITGNTTRIGCENTQIDFSAGVDGAAMTFYKSVTAVNGNFSVDYQFKDGGVTVFEGKSTVAGSTPNGFTAITDFTPPTLQINAPVPNGSKALFLVAKNGNLNVKAGALGFIPELDNTVADGQVLFDLVATGAGSSAGSGSGTVEILQGTTSVYSTSSASNAAQSLTPTVTLYQAYVGKLFLKATDYAGNSASTTWDLTVDVVPPPAPPVITDPSAANFTHVVDDRHADVDFYWSTPVDDGPAGQTLSWQCGYTTSTALGSAIFDDTTFDNSTVTLIIPGLGTPGTPGTAVGRRLTQLPPLNTLLFAPRLVDEVGNRSSFASTSVSALWRTVRLDFPGSSTSLANFGATISEACDIDGDGNADFVVGAPSSSVGGKSNTGSLVVYYGGSAALTRRQEFDGATDNAYYGFAYSLGDINGDGHCDLLAYSAGGIAVYLAPTAGGMLPSSPSFSFTSASLLYAVRVLPDVNSDGINEIVVANPFAGTGGVVYLFYGRSDWTPLISGGSIDSSVSSITINAQDAGAFLASGVGFIGMKDVDADGKGDLLLPATGINKAFFFSGSKLASAGTLTTANATQTFSIGSGVSFGSSATRADINDDGRIDLLIGDLQAGSVYAFTQTAAHSFDASPTQAPWVSGPSHLGASLAQGDLSGDGVADVVFGSNTPGIGNLWVAWSHPSAVSIPPTTMISAGLSYGSGLAILDVNNDGKLDLIIGESGNGNGTIEIRY
jgi:hypothetical protein